MSAAFHEAMIGRMALVTTDGWFIAPDGEQYRAVFGTLRGVHSDSDTLGIKTNARSTNWYLQVGDMLIAGCQIHYVMLADRVSLKPPMLEGQHEGRAVFSPRVGTHIWCADEAARVAAIMEG